MDFYQIKETTDKKGNVTIFPEFKVGRSKDMMVRGKKFYAIWDEEKGLWSTDEYDVQRLVDAELWAYKKTKSYSMSVRTMADFSSNSWLSYRNYIGHVSDNSHELDCNLTFSNTVAKKTDYVSKRLSYPLEEGPHDAYDEIIGTLYTEEERKKLEWAIGAIIAGDAKTIQKFLVLYGDAGAGKSTILNIIQKLFESYYAIFEAKELTASNNSFATGAFKTNPLVGIQHDGDLSRIEDNTKLNSIVSHEELIINEKYETKYTMRINSFLFMATNKPVKITDGKSGIIRRLIDVRPSGKKVPNKRYDKLMEQINFELGAIAYHCWEVYKSMGKGYYNSYRPVDMMYKTDPFFNFVEDSCEIFKQQDSTTLRAAYAMYKEYCEESGADYKLQMYKFREELKNYFNNFEDFAKVDNKLVRSYYSGFHIEKFERDMKPQTTEEKPTVLVLEEQASILDSMCSGYPAQYATATTNETPTKKWAEVIKTLADINTHKVHYVKVPENHIVIDFDLKDESGKKSFERNLEAASKWPSTYAELSKGGSGIHLHYIYTGDISKLSRLYAEDIEVKVSVGDSSIRRKLTKCNNIPVATISSGLPLKQEGDKMVNFNGVKTERTIRAAIKKALNKQVHAGTKSNVDFIVKVLDDAYKEGISYDITDMRPAISAFAAKSTHQSLYCIKLVNKMKFKSDEPSVNVVDYASDTLIFYDVEVFSNVFIVCWKKQGSDKVIRMINPSPTDIEELLKYKLVGFNCRRYDNHILYAKMMGYNNEQLYNLSQRIINNSKNALFGEAYNLSYTDVYDFLSAGNKMSLKKWEIKLGIHHMENSYEWDKPLPESAWEEVTDYCCNDVIATEAVFVHNSADWTARRILADLAGMSVNDTTNTLTTRIIFGSEKKPQREFNYRDMSKPVEKLDPEVTEFLKMACPKMMSQSHYGWNNEGKEEVPFSSESILPYFPGYKFEMGKSTYRNTEVGEGGEVYAEPGMYGLVALLDIASMHPHSGIAECIFGVRFTTAFRDIVEGRVNIKHEAWDIVNSMLNGKLTPFIQMVIDGKMTSKQLADALKTAINSVYGLTSASFDNAFRDPRNIDNIIAKRGALFMIDLRYAVQAKGFVVAHIKTDSIKIPDATTEIIDYVMEFGERYGYTFEHEATYEKMCLVNNAVYIAKYATAEMCQKQYGYVPGDNKKHPGEWTATGKQFAVPYVFKTLFSKEAIEFEDMCETMSVTSALYLDMNDGDHKYRFVGKIGNFCPIKPGCGGGELLRIGTDKEGNAKYSAATGSKGYRWLESDMVKSLGKEADVDQNFYIKLVDDAVTSISQYGDFEWFVSDDPYIAPPFNGGRVF